MPVLAVWTRPLTPFLLHPRLNRPPTQRRMGATAVLFCRVCALVRSRWGPLQLLTALLSNAFMSNKKGTHEKDMGEGPL
jgi:hypothetical protein